MPVYYATFDRGDPPTNKAWLLPNALANKTVAVRRIGTGTTYTQIFDYPAGGNTAGTQNVAHYVGTGVGFSAFSAGVCVNITHDSLLVEGAMVRLRRATGTTAETTGVTGTLTKRTTPYGGFNYVCFRVGSVADMTAAFGTANTTSGANWILESATSGTTTTDLFPLANELVSGDRVFAWDTDLLRPAPASDTTNWTVIPGWSATSAYAQGAIVQDSGVAYRALNPISAPSQATTYANYATWNNFDSTASPNNASGTTNGADYYAGSGTVGNYAASLFVNITPLSTGATYTNISNNNAPPGTYRLRRVGGGLTGNVPGFIIGTVDIRQPDNAGRRAIRISPSIGSSDRSQDMIDAFGSGTPSNAGTWVLEVQTTTPGSNTAPGSDTTNWEIVNTPAWTPLTMYGQNDAVVSANVRYTANASITVTGGIWHSYTPPPAPAGNDALLENGSALLLENGSRLLLENS